MSLETLVDQLESDLNESGGGTAHESVTALCQQLAAPLDGMQVRRALKLLRGKRCYSQITRLADCADNKAEGVLKVHIRRHAAQAAIDEWKDYEGAASKLEQNLLELQKHPSDTETSETTGLLGRIYKDLFLKAAAAGDSDVATTHLKKSVAYYRTGFRLDPAWHGSNLIALTAKGEREGFQTESKTATEWAQEVLTTLEEKVALTPWDHCTQGEAYLVRGQHDKAANSFSRYWEASEVDAFALAGTERQLRQFWLIEGDPNYEFVRSVLIHLQARRIASTNRSARFTVEEMMRFARELETTSHEHLEALFGPASSVPLQKVLGLLERAKSICKVTPEHDPDTGGTGFLVNGGSLTARLAGQTLLLTNHHVLHGRELTDELREISGNYEGAIDIEDAVARFQFFDGKDGMKVVKLREILHYSPAHAHDFALATLEEQLNPDRCLTLSEEPKPLGSRNFRTSKRRSKIFVVGHPQSKSLSFSFSDNEVVDHELDDQPKVNDRPRRIHYRAATEEGSSGSPVFNNKDLRVVGLHRAGSAKPLRDDWPRESADQTYEANEAISIRSIRECLVQDGNDPGS